MIISQKDELVNSVKMHFLRTTGKFVDVGGIKIRLETWKNIAESVNLYGIPKKASEWRTSFYRMKLRVKKIVDNMVEKSAKSGHPINIGELSESDRIIAKMFYFEQLTHKKIEYATSQILSSSSHQGSQQLQNTESSVSLDGPLLKAESTSRSFLQESINFSGQNIRVNRGGKCVPVSRSLRCVLVSRSRGRVPVSRGGGRVLVSRVPHTGKHTRVIRKPKTKLPRKRITIVQQVRLLELVQANFMTAVGRFSGANGVAIQRRIWQYYANELNAIGPKRTASGWKTVFTAMRLRTKRKMALLRKSRNLTGGGESCFKDLNEMDEQILSMIGVNNLDGQQNLGEGGFPFEKTLPFRQSSSTNQREATLENELLFDETFENINYEVPQDPCALSCSLNDTSQDLEVSESENQMQNASSLDFGNARGHSPHDENFDPQESAENVFASNRRIANVNPIQMSNNRNARRQSPHYENFDSKFRLIDRIHLHTLD